MNYEVVVYLCIVLLPMLILFAALPFINRKTISFGISIKEQHYDDPEVKAMRKRYLWWHIGFSFLLLLTVILFSGSLNEQQFAIVIITSVISILLFNMITFLYYHFKMKRLKREKGWYDQGSQVIVVDTSFHQYKSAYSNLWFLIHFGLVAINVILVALFYDQIPETLITHYDFQGNPDKFSEKRVGTVFFANIIQIFIILTMLLVNFTIRKSKQQINPNNPEKSMRQNLRHRRGWSLFTIILGLLMVLLFSFVQLSIIFSLSGSVIMMVLFALIFLTFAGAIITILVTRDRGSNVAGEKGSEILIDDDRYWKLGAFYYNPEDPSIFVEKRFGIGWTLNFARAVSWFILFGPLLFIFILIWFVEK